METKSSATNESRVVRFGQSAACMLIAVVMTTACAEGPENATRPGFEATTQVAATTRARPATIDEVLADVSVRIPGFAGVYRDDQGNLVVRSTRSDLAPEAVRGQLRDRAVSFLTDRDKAIGGTPITVLPAEYDFRELSGWRNKLRGVDWGAHGIHLLSIDERANRVRIGVLPGSTGGLAELLASLRIPEAAVAIEVTEPGSLQKKLSHRYRPIPGAVRVMKSNNNKACTLAVNTRSSIGDGFITASHCSSFFGDGPDGTAFYQNAKVSGDWVGNEAADPDVFQASNCPPNTRGCRMSDATLIKYNAGVWHEMGTIVRTTRPGSTDEDGANPRWKISSIQDVIMNDPVIMVGQTNGWKEGVVFDTCVDWAPPTTDVGLLCQVQASYASAGGDSGAPILKWTGQGDFVALVGIHSGISETTEQTFMATFSSWNQVDFEVSSAIGGIINPLY